MVRVISLDLESGMRRPVQFEQARERGLENRWEWETVSVYPDYRYAAVEGYGCALTESACSLLYAMPAEDRRRLLEAWFAPQGAGARYVRVHADSCDYSLTEYQAVRDVLADPELETFDISRDEKYIIPAIREACAVAGRDLEVMLSPWSPPAEWKTPPYIDVPCTVTVDGVPRSRCGGGALRPEYYRPWARYLVKYLLAYLERGVNVTMLTPQNETYAYVDWDSCVWSPEEMREFICRHLAPEMRAAGVADRVGIYLWDFNKDHMVDFVDSAMSPELREAVAGVALHWYSGDHFPQIAMIAQKYPEFTLVHSESCILSPPDPASYGEDARRYAHDMIGDFNTGVTRWIDWNIVVDDKGGPRHTPGGFAAPAVWRGGALERTQSLDVIELFAHTIPEGSVRVGSSSFSRDVEVAAARRPDNTLGAVLLNHGPDTLIHLRAEGDVFSLTLPAGSFTSVII